uniref:Lamina-associated polypeptide 2 alpha C-terminal domain-containing protein n=1 Tax=Xenopus tropicalis TaxID=8364 RepID=A0A803JDW7_XENTR
MDKSGKRKRKSRHLMCSGCNQLLPDNWDGNKCSSCLQSPVSEPHGNDTNQFINWFKSVMLKAMDDYRASPVPSLHQDSLNKDSDSDAGSSGEVLSSSSCSEPHTSQKEDFFLFPVEKMPRLIKEVCKVISPKESTQTSSSAQDFPFFSQKKALNFPVHPSVKNLIEQEWKNPGKKPESSKRFKLMFPFENKDIEEWENPPKVDTPVARLSKRTTIPVEEAAIKDQMDRRAERALRRSYISGALVCKPSLAAVSVSRSLKHWINTLEEDIDSGISRDVLLDMLYPIKLAVDFLCDVSVDTLKLGARTMALSTAGRRALWLKAWAADSASKNSLISMPFEPGKLFGSALDKLIENLSTGKDKVLPQERQKPHYKSTFRPSSRRNSPKSNTSRRNFREGNRFSYRNFRSRNFRSQPSRDSNQKKDS